ncbi:MAG: TonB-dependent receptor [Bacteroidota bacterium]
MNKIALPVLSVFAPLRENNSCQAAKLQRGFIFLLMVLLGVNGFAQEGIVRGRVSAGNGEPLQGAVVVSDKQKKGTYTNEDGIFSLDLPVGEDKVRISYFGYKAKDIAFTIKRNETTTLRISLEEETVETEVVEIVSDRKTTINQNQATLGKIQIEPSDILDIPSIGAPDLAQYLQVLPGVVFTGDQGGQLYIRGGTPVQNMVYMDGMILYRPFHSIGLFSVFDPDYIRSADLYSAAFPAQFGGRISSVLNIKTRTPDVQRWGGSLNLGPFMSSALVEGPIVKGKREGTGLSGLVSYRRNYMDEVSPDLYDYVNDGVGVPFNFTDIYGKLSLTDGANQLSVFGFSQEDAVNYEVPASTSWESSGGGATFQLLPSAANAIITGNLAFSNYEVSQDNSTEAFPRTSQINGFNGGLDISYLLNSVDELSFGVNILGFTTDFAFTNSFNLQTSQQSNNTEAAIYVRWKKVLLAQEDNALSQQRWVIEPSARVHYFNDQQHLSFEPRLRVKWSLPKVSVSIGTGMFTQNLISAVSDRDIVNFFQGIIAAPPSVPDQIKDHALQTAVHGLAAVEVLPVQGVKIQLEGWVKDFTQLTNINRLRLFEEDPLYITETGLSYGVDVSADIQRKNLGLTLNYGWSKNERTDPVQTYAPVWDRRHSINALLAYKSSAKVSTKRDAKPRWDVNVRWNLGSGFPFTQTQGFFPRLNFDENGTQTDILTQTGELALLLSEDLNAGRLPWFHRLDASVTYRFALGRIILSELTLSAINLYDRQNVFYLDRISNERVDQLPFLPSLNWRLNF